MKHKDMIYPMFRTEKNIIKYIKRNKSLDILNSNYVDDSSLSENIKECMNEILEKDISQVEWINFPHLTEKMISHYIFSKKFDITEFVTFKLQSGRGNTSEAYEEYFKRITTQQMALEFIKKDPRVFSYIKEEYKENKDFCLKEILKANADAIEYFSVLSSFYKEACLEAVKNKGTSIKYTTYTTFKKGVDKNFLKELYTQAIKSDGSSVYLLMGDTEERIVFKDDDPSLFKENVIPGCPKNKTKEIFKKALKGECKKYLDKEVCRECIGKDPLVLEYIKEGFFELTIIKKTLTENDIEDLEIEAVKLDVDALKFVKKIKKNHLEIALKNHFKKRN